MVTLWNLRNFTNPLIRFACDFYPLVAMLFFYKEIGLLVHQYFDWTLDEWLLGVDNEMGKIGFRVWNFQKFYPPARLLNEFFSIGYSFYFILMPLSALVLYFRAPRARFREFMFSLSFTYYLHYLIFIFLPAESPRFYMPGLRESLQGYWVSDWLQAAVENNAFPGGSFPSSHIAASVICFMAYRYFGKWRFLVLFLTMALFAGTIYGRYHYFVDVMAGLGVGLFCYFLAPWLERNWPLHSMKKDWSVSEQDKPLTEAEKQIRRLQALRQGREEVTQASVERSNFPSKTQAQRTTDKLTALRDAAQKPAGSKRRPKIEGKQKSSKLTFTQIRVLEQILERDKKLRGSVVTRIALNRLLGLDNSPEENDLEAELNEILRQLKSRS